MADQQLTCRDCGAEFGFSEGEQAFYAERQLAAPQRCKACRDKRKQDRLSTREMHPAKCASCGADCEVPFKPRPDGRPVLCLNCFRAQKGGGGMGGGDRMAA